MNWWLSSGGCSDVAGSGRRRVLQRRAAGLTGVVRGTVGSRLRGDATDAVPRRTSGPVRCMDNLVLGGCLAPPASAL